MKQQADQHCNKRNFEVGDCDSWGGHVIIRKERLELVGTCNGW
jgi:hypothetical protein